MITALLNPESLVFGGDATDPRGIVGTLVVGSCVGGEGAVGRLVGCSAGGREGTCVKRTGDGDGLVGVADPGKGAAVGAPVRPDAKYQSKKGFVLRVPSPEAGSQPAPASTVT